MRSLQRAYGVSSQGSSGFHNDSYISCFCTLQSIARSAILRLVPGQALPWICFPEHWIENIWSSHLHIFLNKARLPSRFYVITVFIFTTRNTAKEFSFGHDRSLRTFCDHHILPWNRAVQVYTLYRHRLLGKNRMFSGASPAGVRKG